MLYTISINQKAALDSGLPLKFQHLAIIAVLHNMFASPDTQEIWHDGRCFKWVALQTICDELPLLSFEKRRVSEIISELELMKVLERHPENQSLRKSFFRAGENWQILFTSMQKNAGYYAEKCIATMQKNADNHNTNNHNTTNHINSEPVFLKESRSKVTAKTNDLAPLKALPLGNLESEDVREMWGNFLEAQTEKGKRVARVQAEQLLKELQRIAGGNKTIACQIISSTITHGWASFYEPKNDGTNTSTKHSGLSSGNANRKSDPRAGHKIENETRYAFD